MYLNGKHVEDIDDGQSVLSRNSESYSNSVIGINDDMPIAFMIVILSGICIICSCIILIFSVCIGGGCAYFEVNRKKMVHSLKESDICNV